MSTIEVKTQTRFMVLFTSRSLTTWGKSPDASPGIFPRYLLTIHPNNQFLHLYRNHMMTEFTFISNRAERWKRIWLPYGGISMCAPTLTTLSSLPFPAELSSVSSFKVWGTPRNPAMKLPIYWSAWEVPMRIDNMVYPLVLVNPKQTRASTMEEAVETLAAYPSSRTDWPYALAQLYEGSHHAPLPKDKHLGILPQGKVEETSCGWISQLDICQPFSTSPQVVYPSGLNGHDEPIITTLPELLSSGTSVIAIEHLYLEIDIPPKALPIGKGSIIQATNPCKSPPKLEGSMTAESITF